MNGKSGNLSCKNWWAVWNALSSMAKVGFWNKLVGCLRDQVELPTTKNGKLSEAICNAKTNSTSVMTRKLPPRLSVAMIHWTIEIKKSLGKPFKSSLQRFIQLSGRDSWNSSYSSGPSESISMHGGIRSTGSDSMSAIRKWSSRTCLTRELHQCNAWEYLPCKNQNSAFRVAFIVTAASSTLLFQWINQSSTMSSAMSGRTCDGVQRIKTSRAEHKSNASRKVTQRS